MMARESASQSRTPTAQTSAGGPAGLAVQALGRDVRQRPGHIADGSQRLGVRELGEPEVEEAHRDLVPVDDEHV